MCRDITKEIDFDSIGLDPEIKEAVKILNQYGIQTNESCQGGTDHAYSKPTITFVGDKTEGFKALDIAIKHGLKVDTIERYWVVDENAEPVGPNWKMTFWGLPVRKGT